MSEPRAPRVVKRWRTQKNDSRAKRVRDYEAMSDLEIVRASTHHKCLYHDCPQFGIVAKDDFYIMVYNHARSRWISGRRVPEVTTYHRGCVPTHLKEAAALLDE